MLKIFIAVIILYTLFVISYLLRLRRGKKRKSNIIGQGGSIRETGHLKTDIVGKSAFDMNRLKPLDANRTPLAASSPKSDNPQDNQNTFAPSKERKQTAELPSDELDEAFSDTPSDENNEPMDIDCPLDYEADEPEETDEDEDETEEVEGTAQAAFASGVEFEDLGNAVRTVNRSKEATPEQKNEAGKTLLEIRRTDMFEQLVSGNPDRQKTVSELMAESLAAFHRRKDKEAGNSGSGRKAPDNFNVRDFA